MGVSQSAGILLAFSRTQNPLTDSAGFSNTALVILRTIGRDDDNFITELLKGKSDHCLTLQPNLVFPKSLLTCFTVWLILLHEITSTKPIDKLTRYIILKLYEYAVGVGGLLVAEKTEGRE